LTLRYAPIEQEAILLKAVWDMIDDMVNLEIFDYPMTSRPTNLVFKSGTHKRVFAILLAISWPSPGHPRCPSPSRLRRQARARPIEPICSIWTASAVSRPWAPTPPVWRLPPRPSRTG
jgi:hypothetical protein